MKILQLPLTYAPNWGRGGPPRVMYDYARALVAKGHEVVALTPEDNKPKADSQWEGFPSGLSVRYYPRVPGRFRARFHSNYSARHLIHLLDHYASDADVIHLSQTRCLLNALALRVARRRRVPIALSSFGSLPRRNGFGKLLYDQAFVLPLVRFASVLFAQTTHEMEVYKAFGARSERVKLLPLAVDSKAVPTRDALSALAFRDRFGIPGSATLFTFVGRLHPTKGLPTLMTGFARTSPANYLAIVGHDEGMAAPLKELAESLGIQSRVRFCGPLYDADRWPAYQASDAFVITPNVFEETSLASVEALFCGTPVITTDRAEIPWLEEYGAGLVVRGGDLEGITAAMNVIGQDDPTERSRRRGRAIELARDRFALTSVADALSEHFSDIVN